MSNPYTLVFGQSPVEQIGRKAQKERIISGFIAERPSNYLNMITGIRGSGKTVFITQIAKQLSERPEWIVVNLNPQRDLLQSLASKLSSSKTVSSWFREAKINLQAFGIGVEIASEPPIADIEEALTRMLLTVREKKKRLLVTVDEAVNSKEMRIFASAFQLFLREDLPIFLLMSGLFKSIDRLRNAEGMTFLERAPRTELSPLDLTAIAKNYMATLKLPEDQAIRLAAQTRGYSFAFQTIGYFSWENPQDKAKAMAEAREYLYEFAYHKIWSELSSKDRQVVSAMAAVPKGEVSQIREQLGYSTNQFNPYRSRLIKMGVAVSPQSGILEFALPWFGEYAMAEQGRIL